MILQPGRRIFGLFAGAVAAFIVTGPARAQTSPAPKGAAQPVSNATAEAGSLHSQAKALADKREYAKAIELYSKAITLSPGYAEAWHDRGVAHISKGDFAIAATDFTRAIELHGKTGSHRQQAASYIDRARALTRMDKTGDALADLDRAGKLVASSPHLLAQRAFTNWRAKKFDDAAADAGRVLALDANSSAGYLARGVRGLVHAERQRFDVAAAEMRDLLKAAPDKRTAVAVLRSNLMLGRGDQPMSIRIVRSADPTCEPDCPEWIAMQGVIERGTDSQFTHVLDRLNGKSLPVLIDSPGGNVEAALAMGRKIRERELDVVAARTDLAPSCGNDAACTVRVKGGRVLGSASDIASLCSSSCAYILAAGARRMVGPLSLVGVHQISFYKVYKEPPTEEQMRKDRLEGRVIVTTPSGPRLLGAVKDASYIQTRTYYRDMDVDESIMNYLLAAPTNGMHWFSTDELVATRLMTGTGFVGQFLAGASVTPSVVTLAAPKASPPAASTAELLDGLTRELARVGCLTADDKASPANIKRGLTRYAALTGSTVGETPTQIALNALRRQAGTVCPETCPRGMSERDGYCIKPTGGR